MIFSLGDVPNQVSSQAERRHGRPITGYRAQSWLSLYLLRFEA
jgi:hypothetical protein